jgi:ferritin-like metal-binding protein YciE
MKFETLRELYIKELQDLYDAENQIIKALPKMIRFATTGSLSSALQEHLEVTKEQVIQLEELFSKFEQKPNGTKCKGMEGLLKEGEETVKEDMDSEVKDAAIIAACQKVEHYEIAGYGCVKTYASLLGDDHAASVLEKILSQEKEADMKLTAIAEEINVEAVGGVKGDSFSKSHLSESDKAEQFGSKRDTSLNPNPSGMKPSGGSGSSRSHRDNS